MDRSWSGEGGPPEIGDLVAISAPPSLFLPTVGAVLALLYLAAAISMWVRGRRWSVGRTVLFVLGCTIVTSVTGLAIENYGYALLSVFMFQQLTLMMLVPPLLVLGSPGTLLLRATPHRGFGNLILSVALRALRSRVGRWLLHPVFTVPLFLLSFYGLYLGGLADVALALPFGHVTLEIAFLVSGVLFAAPILSSDPLPLRMSHAARTIDITAEVALHAFFGVFLMISPTLLVDSFASASAAIGVDPLADQALAGGLAWSYGEGPNAILLIYVLHRWFRDDTARARAADRHADRHGNPDLDAYNAYLNDLRSRDIDRETSEPDPTHPIAPPRRKDQSC